MTFRRVTSVSFLLVAAGLASCDSVHNTVLNTKAGRLSSRIISKVQLQTEFARVDEAVQLNVLNPSSEPANLIRFDSSCDCSKPQFDVCTIPGLTSHPVEVRLDTNQMQLRQPKGGSVTLVPVFQHEASAEQETFSGQPIELSFKLHAGIDFSNRQIIIDPMTREGVVTAKVSKRIATLQVSSGNGLKLQSSFERVDDHNFRILAVVGEQALGELIPILVEGLDANQNVICSAKLPIFQIEHTEPFLTRTVFVPTAKDNLFETRLVVPNNSSFRISSIESSKPDAISNVVVDESERRVRFNVKCDEDARVNIDISDGNSSTKSLAVEILSFD